MSGRTAGRHQGGADANGGCALGLQAVQGHQQRLERTGRQRLAGLVFLVLLKRAQALGLKHPFSFIGEQHGVAVKRDPHFVRVRRRGMGRMRVHLRGRDTRVQRGPHIAQVGR